jgi:hypothetical protein
MTADIPRAHRARQRSIHDRLQAIDAESTRPLRSVLAGFYTQTDLDKLAALEAEATALRAELAALNN